MKKKDEIANYIKKKKVKNICKHGTYKTVKIINKQNKSEVLVDACISEEIQMLNDEGVITLGCCCSHGKAGQIVEYENAYGKWKEHCQPPIALVRKESVQLSKELGYKPYPYYYADGTCNDVYQIHLKTGDIYE